MANQPATALVSTDWLHEHLDAPDVRIADATWFLPTLGRDARAEYDAAHLRGAVFVDIDDVADERSPYPHAVPGAAKFSSRMRRLGLGDGVRIVAYDNNAFCASARLWWLLRLFGHGDAVVLDGGLAKWHAEGRPLDDAPVRPVERHFTARQNNLLLRELDQMRTNVRTRREQVVDARSRSRFDGVEPEPRPGLRGGHIPGSLNLPFGEILASDGTLPPKPELERRFRASGVDLARPVVTSCGSGVSAAVLLLGLHELGRADAALYDGSWAEWGAQADTPVEG